MIPVLSPGEVAEVDAASGEPVEVLVERAGRAVFLAAGRLLGGLYGRRILVVAGRGNNGADGRAAARLLASRGARTAVVEAAGLHPGARLPPADLVIDAAYGTGLNRPWAPPDPGPSPVLAVDIPSGLSGQTGEGEAMAAVATVTFAGYKPGLLLGAGPQLSGAVTLAGIGLGGIASDRAGAFLVEDSDVATLPARPRSAHKWQSALAVVGGSPAMYGAPLLAARAALRAGAGYALVGVPGAPEGGGLPPGEQVGVALPGQGWAPEAAAATARAKAMAVGPGLGERAAGGPGRAGPDSEVGRLLAGTAVPAVVDADGIAALGGVAGVARVCRNRPAPIVLTPHDGEFARLTGSAPGPDRITEVRNVARQTGAVVLLKGPTTVVAGPDGRVLLAAAGRPNLATAGTGDTLTGIIGAFLARGVPALQAAAIGAHVHGRAAQRGWTEGLVASDLPELVAGFLSERAAASPLPAGPG